MKQTHWIQVTTNGSHQDQINTIIEQIESLKDQGIGINHTTNASTGHFTLPLTESSLNSFLPANGNILVKVDNFHEYPRVSLVHQGRDGQQLELTTVEAIADTQEVRTLVYNTSLANDEPYIHPLVWDVDEEDEDEPYPLTEQDFRRFHEVFELRAGYEALDRVVFGVNSVKMDDTAPNGGVQDLHLRIFLQQRGVTVYKDVASFLNVDDYEMLSYHIIHLAKEVDFQVDALIQRLEKEVDETENLPETIIHD